MGERARPRHLLPRGRWWFGGTPSTIAPLLWSCGLAPDSRRTRWPTTCLVSRGDDSAIATLPPNVCWFRRNEDARAAMAVERRPARFGALGVEPVSGRRQSMPRRWRPSTAVGSLAACAAATWLLAQAACFGSTRQGTGCEDCATRVTATLPPRLVLVPESGGSPCPRVITDAGGHRLTLLRLLSNDRADYSIAPGVYGARENEALRVHCKDGTVAGLVHL